MKTELQRSQRSLFFQGIDMSLYTTATPISHVTYDARNRTFVSIMYNKFVAIKRLIWKTRRYLLVQTTCLWITISYKLQNFVTNVQTNVVTIWQLETPLLSRNGKKKLISKFLVVLGINFISQIRINACTLILEKNFWIYEIEKSIYYKKYMI